MATISSSVRLSPPFEGAISGLGANRAALLLAFLLVGVTELGEASGLDTSTIQADLHHVLRYHLPEPLRCRLEAVQDALSGADPGGEALRTASQPCRAAPAFSASTARRAGVPTPAQMDEREEPAAEQHPLAGEGDDY